MQLRCLKIHIDGLVQGVGFRPYIYRLAKRFEINGTVENSNEGVFIIATATNYLLDQFLIAIRDEKPAASSIDVFEVNEIPVEYFDDFNIVKSKNTSEEITEISPDITVCEDCLQDIKNQPRRMLYPFTNCTNCGPRFTIIQYLPYDRAVTTMQSFEMCDDCKKEYTDMLDRRFHAQPVACNNCGPTYTLILHDKFISDFDEILNCLSMFISTQKIVATKGLGGFHFMCNAFSIEAVNKLRNIKQRETKPFAVMFKNLKSAKMFVYINEYEEKSLTSWQRPIVLLRLKENNDKIADSICNGLNTLGVMLPYLPMHYLMFEKFETEAVVLTSGNLSDEPIVIDNQKAIDEFGNLVDAVLIYNRAIFNRTDDSVAMVANGKERLLRRSRGFVPKPVKLNIDVDGIVALGAELVNCFCVGKGNKAILSQHIGDLKNWETFDFFTETLEKFIGIFRINPSMLVTDLHPDYLSSTFFETMLKNESSKYHLENLADIPVFKVQHHHAHIASCMAENGLDEKLIGVSFDGTGYGTDGNIWGGEFLVCDLKSFERAAHFDYVPMPSGDKAVEEPWRMAVSFLHKYIGNDFINFDLPFLKNVNQNELKLILLMLSKNFNCPLTSSAGRLFDAVAALTGLCCHSQFHAQAPMLLESVIEHNCNEKYPFTYNGEIILFDVTIKNIIDDILNNVQVSLISAKFHNTIIDTVIEVVKDLTVKNKINKVALSGGVFQNKYLLENIERRFANETDLMIFTHQSIPSNDGGIALGQLAIASKNRK